MDYVFATEELRAHLAKMRATFPAQFGYNTEISMVPPERLQDVVASLLQRGYTDRDIRAIFGGNFPWVALEVW